RAKADPCWVRRTLYAESRLNLANKGPVGATHPKRGQRRRGPISVSLGWIVLLVADQSVARLTRLGTNARQRSLNTSLLLSGRVMMMRLMFFPTLIYAIFKLAA